MLRLLIGIIYGYIMCVKIINLNYCKLRNVAFYCGLHCKPKYQLIIYQYTKRARADSEF